jgi:hypothetical protein
MMELSFLTPVVLRILIAGETVLLLELFVAAAAY